MNKRLSFTASLTILLLLLIAMAGTLLIIVHTSTPSQVKTASPTSRQPAPAPPPPYEFPAGGRTLSDTYRFIALYGSIETPLLGVLGEQSIADSIKRVTALANQYTPLTKEHVYPTFEIIATVAAAGPTDDGDYSRKADVAQLRPWVDAAKKAGIYVVLDLQPGRSSFLEQAKHYESLLRQPHVGLALDPEWRLAPHEYPLGQIGRVSAAEINHTSQWLSDLIEQHDLPQKLLLIHQFQLASLPDRMKIEAHKNLMTVIQMDGQGSQGAKTETWKAVLKSPPKGILFGWKNFHDEDSPTLSPAQTMQLTPMPWYVSYQ